MLEWKIQQIIPAPPGLKAINLEDDGTMAEKTIICLALVDWRDEGLREPMRSVIPMVSDEAGIDLVAFSSPSYLGIKVPGDPVDWETLAKERFEAIQQSKQR
jgi:hypothetical protein